MKNKTPQSAKKLADKAKNLRISTNKLYRLCTCEKISHAPLDRRNASETTRNYNEIKALGENDLIRTDRNPALDAGSLNLAVRIVLDPVLKTGLRFCRNLCKSPSFCFPREFGGWGIQYLFL